MLLILWRNGSALDFGSAKISKGCEFESRQGLFGALWAVVFFLLTNTCKKYVSSQREKKDHSSLSINLVIRLLIWCELYYAPLQSC